MKKIRSVMAISLLIASASAAGAATQNIPPSLYRVDGRPVPSSCLSDLAGMGDSQTVNLTHCGDPSVKPKSLPTGVIGYEDPQGGYFYYRYLGKADGLDILYTESSGGGSGQFTSLVGILRNGQTLVPKRDYAAGDRCNGGLSGAALANGRVTFDQAITPHALIALGDPGTKLQAYKDLEDAATSCIGESHMAGDDKHWTGVTLTNDSLTDQKGWTEQYRYQACFNALYRETVAQHHAELDRNGVKAFAASFTKRCLRPKS
jgi:hypothetical protein